MAKTILLTGATDGIGLAAAEKLAAQGHHLLIHGRSAEKLDAVGQQLSALGGGAVDKCQADLSDLGQVKAMASAISAAHSHIDVIINNAGVFKTDAPISKDNLDVRFVVNTLAPYLLTQQLLPLMNQSGRIINLSSAAQAPVDLDAMAGTYHLDDDYAAYAQSKLAITMWSFHLAQSLGDKGPLVIAVNPGSLLASKMVTEGFGVEGKDINIGADILLRTALDDEFANASGCYFDNDAGEIAQPHLDATNTEKCAQVVEEIEKIMYRMSE